jgi:hypothetical protein
MNHSITQLIRVCHVFIGGGAMCNAVFVVVIVIGGGSDRRGGRARFQLFSP